jgi:hypothetical protein
MATHDGSGGSNTVDADVCMTTTDASGTVVIAGCTVPAALTTLDPTCGQCRGASRGALACTNPAGTIQDCLSNEAQCPSGYNSSVPGPWTCQNLCAPSEFAIACGSIGPGPDVTPPPGCRLVLPTPGGIGFYCCGCGA